MHKKIFYLIGFQRSGTTLLCHLLDKHPEVVCVEEPELSKRLVYKQYDLLKDANFDSIKQSLNYYKVSPQKYLDLVDEYFNNHLNHDVFLRNCYHLFNKKEAECEGAKEVCDSTAYKYDYLRKLISFHNGKAKFIFIERDIKGVVNSFIKLGFFPPGKRKLTNFNLKRFAKAYTKCTNYIERSLSRDNTYYLTFEDLMLKSEKKLEEIYTFLNVDFSATVVTEILNTPSRGVRQVYNGLKKEIYLEWQKNLNEKQIAWLDKLYSNKRLHGGKVKFS